MKKEIWKDIPGYEGVYQVSSFGRVRSLDRITSQNRKIKGVVLSVGKSSSGYNYVRLSKNGKNISKSVHKLVAMAFLNHMPDGTHKICVDYIDFNRRNNNLNNLRLLSARDNTNNKHRPHSSKYTGVSWYSKYNKWVSRIEISRKKKLSLTERVYVKEDYRVKLITKAGFLKQYQLFKIQQSLIENRFNGDGWSITKKR